MPRNLDKATVSGKATLSQISAQLLDHAFAYASFDRCGHHRRFL